MASVWMVGLEDEPARCGEICVFEVFGDTLATDGGRPTAAVGMGVHPFRDPALTDEFAAEPMAIDVAERHLYAAHWGPGRVDFLVDGEHVKTVHQAPDYPMQMMIAVFDFPRRAMRRRPTTCRCWPSTASAARARRRASAKARPGHPLFGDGAHAQTDRRRARRPGGRDGAAYAVGGPAAVGASAPSSAAVTAVDWDWNMPGATDYTDTIAAGGTVTFSYPAGVAIHNVDFTGGGPTVCTQTAGVAAGPVSPLPAMPEGPGWSGVCRFDTPGTYQFVCDNHNYMKGTIVVEGAGRPRPRRARPRPRARRPRPRARPGAGGATPGDSSSPSARPRVSVAHRQQGAVLRGTVTTPAGRSQIRVTAYRRAHGSRIRSASQMKRSAGTGTTAFAVTLDAAGRRALLRAHRLAVDLRVVITPGRGTARSRRRRSRSRCETAEALSGRALERGAQSREVGRAEDHAIARGDVDEVEVDPGAGDPARQVGQHAWAVLDVDHHDLALARDREMRDGQRVPGASACLTRMCSSARSPVPRHVAAAMFTPASLIAAATSARAPGVLSRSMTRSTAMWRRQPTSHAREWRGAAWGTRPSTVWRPSVAGRAVPPDMVQRDARSGI
jgi:plastocyanin